MKRDIKLLIVDDSAVARDIMSKVLAEDDEITIIGEAKNGLEAVDFVRNRTPDLIMMDLHMPIMDGLEATKKIMAIAQIPIVMISAFPYKDGKSIVFDALDAGAVDVLEKPAAPWLRMPAIRGRLIRQLKILAEVKIPDQPAPEALIDTMDKSGGGKSSWNFERVIGVVASTGGPQAIKKMLREIPADQNLTFVIAQHITEGFTSGLAEWLDHGVNMIVKVAEDKEFLAPGYVYIAPDRHHIEVDISSRIKLIKADKNEMVVPSGNRLLSSLAKSFATRSIGIVLTGMGTDGAEGLLEMKKAGATTIAQDESTCIVFGMPKAAIEINAVKYIAPIEQIYELLAEDVKVKA